VVVQVGLAGDGGEVEKEERGDGEQREKRGQRERAGEGGEYVHSGHEEEERVQNEQSGSAAPFEDEGAEEDGRPRDLDGMGSSVEGKRKDGWRRHGMGSGVKGSVRMVGDAMVCPG
jgi:hypothetical protein